MPRKSFAKRSKPRSTPRPRSSSSKSSDFQPLGAILGQLDLTRDKYLSREWQSYGVHLSQVLGDPQHKSLYIKMARDEPRSLLQHALSFVKDAQARSKAKLWMWKVQQLKKDQQDKSTKKQKNWKT